MYERESRSLRGTTLIISGGSRGIGEAIAVRAARDGANIALLAKTADPHPKLPGTIFTATKATEDAGGHALPIVSDVRDDQAVHAGIDATVAQFGGIDSVVNNASALDLTATDQIAMKKYDVMQDINARGAFLLSKLSIPRVRKSDNAHILTLANRITLDPKYFEHIGTAYAMSKFATQLGGQHDGHQGHDRDQLTMAAYRDRHRRSPQHTRWWTDGQESDHRHHERRDVSHPDHAGRRGDRPLLHRRRSTHRCWTFRLLGLSEHIARRRHRTRLLDGRAK